MTTQLTFTDRAVASAAASPYKPFNIGRIVRRVFWNIAVAAVLFIAASKVDGWLSIALGALLVTRLMPYLFMGLGQRVKDEHAARLAILPPSTQALFKSDSSLARQWKRVGL